jgi:RHS repeat-associated protein
MSKVTLSQKGKDALKAHLDLTLSNLAGTLQQGSDVEYHVNTQAGVLSAVNPTQQFSITYVCDGVHVTPHSGDWTWGLRLVRNHFPHQDGAFSEVSPVSSENRVEYRYDDLTEWYLNGPLGLEQGFTLYAPRSSNQGDQTTLEVEFLGDLSLSWSEDSKSLLFANEQGETVFEYSQLYAQDARGRTLPAHFQPSSREVQNHITIQVDATHAVYPIIVDPLAKRKDLLAASDGVQNDHFGYAVAVDDDIAVVGAYNATTAAGVGAGAVYIFGWNGISWEEETKLIGSDSAAGDNFGYSVAIDVNTVVIGAPNANIGSATDAGAAYIFTRNGATWTQQAKLAAAAAAVSDAFGRSVAIDGDTVAIGAPFVAGADINQGAVYVFTRSGVTWSQQQKLSWGFAGDNEFGCSVGVRGNRLVIGACGYDEWPNYIAQGYAFVYVRSGTTWSQQARLFLTNRRNGDGFGASVAISPDGNYVIVGAPYRESINGTDAGAAYVFVRSGTSWLQQAELLPDIGNPNDSFGHFVAVNDAGALVATPYFNNNRGAVFYFGRKGTSWLLRDVINATNPAIGDSFGVSLGMTNQTSIIGASGRDNSTGAAFVFPEGPGIHPNPKAPSPDIGTCDAGEISFQHPIGIRSGEKREEIVDLLLNTATGPFSFKRIYLQNEQPYYQFMGLGWTHNHNISLTKITSSPNQIVIRWDNGGEAHFSETSPDHYEGVAGIPASFVDWDSSSNHCILTTSNKSTAVFDSQGKLLSRNWTSGDSWTYIYNSNQLIEINDGYGRKLVFRYYTNGAFSGQLFRVGDHTFDDANPSSPAGRYVEYSYSLNRIADATGAIVDGTNALLTNVRDVRGGIWQYTYYGQAANETDARQLNYLVKLESPSVDTTGDGSPDTPITIKHLSYMLQGTELAVNGGMELTSSWTNISGAAPTVNQRSNTQVDSGSYSRRVVTNAANRGVEGTAWAMINGRIYIITARVYVVSGVVKMQVTGQTAFDQLSNITGAWQTLRSVYKATADITGCKLQFTSSGSAAEFYVDTVSILESDLSATTIVQERGDSAISTTFDFQPQGKNLTAETTGGRTTNHWFDNGVYAGGEDQEGNFNARYLDWNYRPIKQIDANENETSLVWSADGKHLTRVVDAVGNETQFAYYNSGDSVDALMESTDAEGRRTEYTYSDSINPRLPTRLRVIDADGVTVLRWQEFVYDSKGRILEEKTIDRADGETVQQRTTRSYYTSGNGNGLLQTITQVDELDAGNNSSTTYTYDSFGRIIKTQKSSLFGSCQISYTVYDEAGNVVASICNYENSGSPPTTAEEAEALYNESEPDKNHVTTYEHDALGRRVQTTVNAGSSFEQTTITVYDALNRVIRTITNYVPDASVPNPYTAAQPAFFHGMDNTENLVTDTAYNARGMVRRQIDVLGNVTVYGYNDADRLIKTIRSASQADYNNDYVGTSPDPSLSNYTINTAPDQDIVTTSEYDPVGNLVKTVDPLGNSTFTVYDALNRPVKVVQKAKDEATIALNPGDSSYVAANDPRSSSYVPSVEPDQDLIELTEYDVMGRVRRTQDVMGAWTLYGYDPLGRQVKVIRSASNPTYSINGDPDLSDYTLDTAPDQDLVTQTIYDANGRVLYTQDSLERRTWFAYDGLGRQVKTIANAVGTATDGGSNDPRSDTYILSTDSDKDLRTITHYDSDGRVQWMQDKLGRKTWYIYDSLGRRIKTIVNCTYVGGSPAPEDPTYVGSSDPDADVITRTEYDAQGRVFATFDADNHETRYFYDVLGRQIKVIRNYVDGVYEANTPDEDLSETTTYDLAGRGVATVDARGTKTAFTYDAAGRRRIVTQAAETPLATTSYTCYDKAGRVLRTIQNWIDRPEQPSPDAREGTGDWLFNPVTHGAHDDENLITTYTPDRSGRTLQVSNALGDSTSTRYLKNGQVQSATDPEATETQYRYDRVNRRTLVVQSFQDNGEDPVLWTRDAADTRWEESDGTPISHGANNDHNVIVAVTYDKAGRVLAQRDPRGNQTSYSYDLRDRRTALTNPLSHTWATAYDDLFDSGAPTGETRATMTYPNGSTHQVQRDLDRRGRLKTIQYLNESPKLTPDVQFAYDKVGNRTAMSEYTGANFTNLIRETQYDYDDLRRLRSVGFDNDGDSTVDETVSYEYDAGGQRTRLTLPGNLSITYSYDVKGRLVSLTDWDAQMTTFAHDNVNRLLATVRANGLRSRYSYDAASRLRWLRHTRGAKTLAHFAYQVDRRGNRTQAVEALAHPATTSDTVIAYDDVSIVTRGTWSNVALFKETIDTGASLKFTFLVNLEAATQPEFTFGTGPDHGIFDVYIGGSLWQSFDGYAATAGERMVSLSLTQEGPLSFEIRTRAAKNLASSGYKVRFKQLLVPDVAYDLHTIQYQYDMLSRLLSADYYPGSSNVNVTPARTYAYAYDLAGNRLSESLALSGAAPTVTSYSYNAANQISNAGFTYDDNGNLTSDGTNSYTWDRANRLLSMGGVSCAYDGEGNRTRQVVGIDVTQYLLDLQPNLATVLQATQGANATRYVHASMGIHAQQTPTGAWQHLATDGLRSVRSVLDNTASVLETTGYAPSGVPDLPLAATNFHFTGEMLNDTGMQYHRARYYNPALGVFPSLDTFEGTIFNPMSLNRYQYVLANPVNRADASGMCSTATYEAGRQAGLILRSLPALYNNGVDGALPDTVASVFCAAEDFGYVVRDVTISGTSAQIAAEYVVAGAGLAATGAVVLSVAGLAILVGAAIVVGLAYPPIPYTPEQLEDMRPPTPQPNQQFTPAPVQTPQPQPQFQATPAPQPQPQLQPAPTATCEATTTPDNESQTIWRLTSTAQNRAAFNWRPSRNDWDGLSGTKGGSPFWASPGTWIAATMPEKVLGSEDVIFAVRRSVLIAGGFSVVDTPSTVTNDPWHVSIGGVTPGIIERRGSPSWPGDSSQRDATANLLQSLFSTIVWP